MKVGVVQWWLGMVQEVSSVGIVMLEGVGQHSHDASPSFCLSVIRLLECQHEYPADSNWVAESRLHYKNVAHSQGKVSFSPFTTCVTSMW